MEVICFGIEGVVNLLTDVAYSIGHSLKSFDMIDGGSVGNNKYLVFRVSTTDAGGGGAENRQWKDYI